jgi:hypothetical protein
MLLGLQRSAGNQAVQRLIANVQREPPKDPVALSTKPNLQGAAPAVTAGLLNGSLFIDGQTKPVILSGINGSLSFGSDQG